MPYNGNCERFVVLIQVPHILCPQNKDFILTTKYQLALSWLKRDQTLGQLNKGPDSDRGTERL